MEISIDFTIRHGLDYWIAGVDNLESNQETIGWTGSKKDTSCLSLDKTLGSLVRFSYSCLVPRLIVHSHKKELLYLL